MKIKHFSTVVAILAIILCVALPQTPAGASEANVVPVYSEFVNTLQDGHANLIRGVYAPGVLAFPVVQQPPNDASAVTDRDGEVSQFRLAGDHRVIGLLAHNTLAGSSFFNLRVGQEIRIIYGNSRVEHYMVNDLARFMVILPGTKHIGYLDLRTDNVYDTQQVFRMFYEGKPHVTLQTCIALGGDTSWGRLFVTAVPVPALDFLDLQFFDLTDLRSHLTLVHTFGFLKDNTIPR